MRVMKGKPHSEIRLLKVKTHQKIYFVNFRVNLTFHENMIPQEMVIKLSPRYQNLVFVD